MEATHVISNPRNGKLEMFNNDDDDMMMIDDEDDDDG
mgnify:CR=1 FL=1